MGERRIDCTWSVPRRVSLPQGVEQPFCRTASICAPVYDACNAIPARVCLSFAYRLRGLTWRFATFALKGGINMTAAIRLNGALTVQIVTAFFLTVCYVPGNDDH